jgi:3-Oxoacyl-[acyl-carrier-protein (ACP)] synthase III
MSGVYVHGHGAVSPAGWGVAAMRAALTGGIPIPAKSLPRPGWTNPLSIRQVPPPRTRPDFLSHSRLRRTSAITHYVVAAALEAIGADAPLVASGSLRLGVVLCVMSGCVNYSRRFYDEVLRDPGTASPLVFPETVFNAPASHLASLLGTPALNYTLVGDPGTFLGGVALAANWLVEDRVDACLVVGAEEADWLTSDAFHLFSRSIILSDGAGALYLKKNRDGAMAELKCVTDCHLFVQLPGRARAAREARAQLPACSANQLLADGLQNLSLLDAAEAGAWRDWQSARISPKTILGEGLMAAAAWQCVAAIDGLGQRGYTAANVSVVGCNQQAIGAHFVNLKTT